MRRKLSRPVDIIGAGITYQGFVSETHEIKNMTSRELWAWAVHEALLDASVTVKEIDAIYVGNMISELTEDQYHLSNLLVQWTGLSTGNGAWKPSLRVEGGGAHGGVIVQQCSTSPQAILKIFAGPIDI